MRRVAAVAPRLRLSTEDTDPHRSPAGVSAAEAVPESIFNHGWGRGMTETAVGIERTPPEVLDSLVALVRRSRRWSRSRRTRRGVGSARAWRMPGGSCPTGGPGPDV